MLGAIGASCVVMNDSTFPRAAIKAMNVRFFDLSSNISGENIELTNIRVITKKIVGFPNSS
jgi:hypothetical protein